MTASSVQQKRFLFGASAQSSCEMHEMAAEALAAIRIERAPSGASTARTAQANTRIACPPLFAFRGIRTHAPTNLQTYSPTDGWDLFLYGWAHNLNSGPMVLRRSSTSHPDVGEKVIFTAGRLWAHPYKFVNPIRLWVSIFGEKLIVL
jgi:hypothetical protein